MTAGLSHNADQAQRRAADPSASVWVAASAGTGKTKVLTDRVLALLLAGTAPHKILCLTFTKAAAAEMANRIAKRLAGWATVSDAGLSDDLARLLGTPPEPDALTRARRLFARVLDVPGGMHIETIHAFCQSLLRRFPLEAGLAPHFQVMDERDAAELLAEARDEVLAAARDSSDSGLARALADVTARIHETAFPELMGELAGDRGRLKRLIDRHGGLEGVVAAVRHRLALAPGDTAAILLADACHDSALDTGACRNAVTALLTGSKSDRDRAGLMAPWLADPAGRAAGFDTWQSAFLTAKGTAREKLCTNGVRDGFPGVEAALQEEAARLMAVADRIKAAGVAEATAALLSLGHALLAAYQRRKTARALMDYDDLILAARELLMRPGAAPWVLFKLDGGIDHVLIDEAQDTNPDQWAVVAALTEEFFAGRGARETVRTVFAVGDAKQSIYSFQRADPRAFEAMRKRFASHVPAAGQDWAEVALQVSFRSTAAVLEAVDAVFANGPGSDGVAAEGDDIRHIPARRGEAGLVELWPPVEPRALDEQPAWKPPIERIRGDQPSARLARLVARRIKAMVDGEILASQGRPVRAGDIMVLVRRRGGFVEDLVRELKGLEVPVAGADRMVLAEQMAVMDLVALANFLLLPEDDLTLATVLKGPLVGFDEDQLFRLAHGRGPAGLWETLKKRLLDDSAFEEAYVLLSGLLAMADHQPPHALFAHVLGPLGGRRKLLARLGVDAEDPLDEFVALTLAFERAHPPSLQGFLRWLGAGAVEIKRDLEQGGRNAVRIMTVHGSKGLQAPVVILPDTLQMPTRGSRIQWTNDELPLWPPSAEAADAVCRAARDAAKAAREREYRRLLYVAMTRAEDRLVVCGWKTRKAPPAGCWYDLVRAALSPIAAEAEDGFLAEAGETADARVLRLACPQTRTVEQAEAPDTAARPAPQLPDWAFRPPPAEPAPPRPLAPSRPDGEEPPVRSPLAGDDGARRFQRGKLIHRLLQTLPNLARETRAAAMLRFLGRPSFGLDAAHRLDIANEVGDILDHPRFAALFGPGSRAEVPVVGRIGERVLSGRVDRLVVTGNEVLVVDYKTNRRPPAAGEAVPPLYVRQMAAYRLALACIYPGRTVRCALVWTDGPALTEIDPHILDDALAEMVGA
ncbi:MAG: double-strand break repair helicase AddA [Magnetospirillum sp.]|nr:double-strand break repair helicase AddA [Magnetospirillum sp.]